MTTIALPDVPFALSDEQTARACFHEVKHLTPWFEGFGGLWDVWLGRRGNQLYTHGRRRGLDCYGCRPGNEGWLSIVEPFADSEACCSELADIARMLHKCRKPREAAA